mgnify:CR=1 FL=1
MGGTPLPAGVHQQSSSMAPTARPRVGPPLPAASPVFTSPAAAQTVVFLQAGPMILAGAPSPHIDRGPCGQCHQIIGTQPVAAAAPPSAVQGSAQGIDWNPARLVGQSPTQAAAIAPMLMQSQSPVPEVLPFQEAHWQGIEVVPLTAALARLAKIPPTAKGVLIDEVTLPADSQGFVAGDLITMVSGAYTTDLESFIQATGAVRDLQEVEVRLLRKGNPIRLWLSALGTRLGTANGEAAPMIPPGSRPPHGYLGACTNCHRIGTLGEGAVDLGDNLTKSAPPIQASQPSPHRDRGPCASCHVIL